MEAMGMIDLSFWRGKRVFITGHTGFKGSWLALWLQELGAVVTGYALAPPTTPNLFEVAYVADGMNSIIGDIRDASKLTAELIAAEPEIVMHLAAQSLVRPSYADPIETYSTNVMGLVNLFEAIRSVTSVRAVVNVTSDKCYENREWVYGYREIDAMGGHDPYSSSKGCSELITSAYRRSFFETSSQRSSRVALASGRAGNVIGGGDWSIDRLIPDILRAIVGGRSVLIRNPTSIRPWQHVLEPLSGYLMLAQELSGDNADAFSQGWNFGPSPGDMRSVEWIVERMIRCWGENGNWEQDPISGPHEAQLLLLDCSKAHRDLGWRPMWNVGEAIEKIVDWHRAFLDGRNMKSFTLNQISDYRNRYN